MKQLVGTMLGVIPLLCGCASVANVDVSNASIANVRRITVLAIREPSIVQVVNIGGAAGALGPIGGLAQGLTNDDHSKAFVEALIQRKVSLKEPMLAAIEGSLQRDGYSVDVDELQWPSKTADGKSDDYSAIRVDSDAILIVWFGVVGYISPPDSLHYEPWVVVKARLIDAKTKKDIYYKTFCVGYEMKVENAVKIPGNPKYRFGSFDDLMTRVDEAIAGLIDCVDIAARQIGSDLAK